MLRTQKSKMGKGKKRVYKKRKEALSLLLCPKGKRQKKAKKPEKPEKKRKKQRG